MFLFKVSQLHDISLALVEKVTQQNLPGTVIQAHIMCDISGGQICLMA